jgi:hypothetical protein
MKTFGFGVDEGRHITHLGSDFIMSRLHFSPGLHVGCMRFPPGGKVGSHPAGTFQLFAVVEGKGWVRGQSSRRVTLHSGEAALWEPDEQHEAGTDSGMVVIVIEGEALGEGLPPK